MGRTVHWHYHMCMSLVSLSPHTLMSVPPPPVAWTTPPQSSLCPSNVNLWLPHFFPTAQEVPPTVSSILPHSQHPPSLTASSLTGGTGLWCGWHTICCIHDDINTLHVRISIPDTHSTFWASLYSTDPKFQTGKAAFTDNQCLQGVCICVARRIYRDKVKQVFIQFTSLEW